MQTSTRRTTVRAVLVVALAASMLTACPPPQPETPPPAAARESVFFVRFGPDLLVPLACWSSTGGVVSKARACTDMVPKGATMMVEGLGEVTAQGNAAALCELSGVGTTALAFSAPAETPLTFPESSAFAVFPEDVSRLVRLDAPASDASLTEALKPQLDAAFGAAEGLHVAQTAEVDIDRDGAVETIAVVERGADSSVTLEGLESAVLHIASDGRARVVHGFATGRTRVLGLFDLDDDGTFEVWIRVDTTQHVVERLEAWRTDGADELGAWPCP